jgi:hypothetical protein
MPAYNCGLGSLGGGIRGRGRSAGRGCLFGGLPPRQRGVQGGLIQAEVVALLINGLPWKGDRSLLS